MAVARAGWACLPGEKRAADRPIIAARTTSRIASRTIMLAIQPAGCQRRVTLHE